VKTTQELIREVSDDGYCRIPTALTPSQIRSSLDLVLQWLEKMRGKQATTVPYLNQNQPMLYNLQNKDARFLELLFSNEQGQAVLRHFLNDEWYKQIPSDEANYLMRSYLARSSSGALPMHIDSFVPYRGDHVIIMQYAIVLEDMNEEKGCTVIVPGSHKSGTYVTQEDRNKAIPVIAEAGDLLIWDSRIWHGTTENTTDLSRWVLIATFARWWIKQAFDIPKGLPASIYETLTNNQRAIMGYCSTPYTDETQGIDMKRGYDGIDLSSPSG